MSWIIYLSVESMINFLSVKSDSAGAITRWSESIANVDTR